MSQHGHAPAYIESNGESWSEEGIYAGNGATAILADSGRSAATGSPTRQEIPYFCPTWRFWLSTFHTFLTLGIYGARIGSLCLTSGKQQDSQSRC